MAIDGKFPFVWEHEQLRAKRAVTIRYQKTSRQSRVFKSVIGS
jgi:hypothetical protein